MKRHVSIILLLLCAGAATGGTLRSYYRQPDGTYGGPDENVVSPEATMTPTQATGKDFTAVLGDGQKVEWYFYSGSPLSGGTKQGLCGTGTPLNLKIDDSADRTLVAHFENVNYTLQYVTNGVAYRQEQHAYDNQVSVAALPDVPSSEGHHYAPYWTASSGGTYAPGATITGADLGLQGRHTDGATITFSSTEIANTYTIGYGMEGGSWPSGYTPPITATYGQPVEIRDSVKTGYRLEGWKLGGTTYPSVNGVTTVSNLTDKNGVTVTLTAVWAPVTYWLGFDPDGGESTLPDHAELIPIALTYDAGPVTLESKEPKTYTAYKDRDGVKGFAGWSNTWNNVVYTNGSLVANAYDKAATNVLVAVWTNCLSDLSLAMHCDNLQWDNFTPNQDCTNEWIAVDDSCARQFGTQDYDSEQQWLSAKVKANGRLSFLWMRSAESSGKLQFAMSTTDDSFGDSKTNLVESAGVTKGKNLSLFSIDVKSDKPFIHLRFNSTNGSCDIDQMKWVPDGYVLHFDANGGSGAPEDVSVPQGKGVRIPKTVPEWTKTDPKKIVMVFDGWTTNGASSAKVDFRPGDWFEDTAAAVNSTNVFFAVWHEGPTEVEPPSAVTGLTYDGSVKTGVPTGANYTLSGNTGVNAGGYTATATLASNCVWSDGSTGPKSIAWSIAKGSYDMSGVTFTGATVTYDGKPHSISVSGTLPSGVTVAYEGNGVVEIGDHAVTAKFTGDAANMNPIADMTATLTIEKGPGESVFAGNANYGGVLMRDGVVCGTISVKAAKARKGYSSVKLTIQPLGGKKTTAKASVEVGGYPTVGGLTYSSSVIGGTVAIDGVPYEAVAQADALTSSDRTVKALAKGLVPSGAWTFSIADSSGVETCFSATVAAKTGKTKVTALLPNGKKVAVSATAVLGTDFKVLSVPVVYSKRDVSFAFLLQVDVGTKVMTLTGLSIPGVQDVIGPVALTGIGSGDYVFSCPLDGTRYLTVVDGMVPGEKVDISPSGTLIAVSNGKWAVEKSVGSVKAEDGRPYVKYNVERQDPANLAKLKLKYAAKTGIVSGSFKLYYMDSDKLKNESAVVSGVVVGNELHGAVTVKKAGLVLPVGLAPTSPAN